MLSLYFLWFSPPFCHTSACLRSLILHSNLKMKLLGVKFIPSRYLFILSVTVNAELKTEACLCLLKINLPVIRIFALLVSRTSRMWKLFFFILKRKIFQQNGKYLVVVNTLFRDEFFGCVLLMVFEVSFTLWWEMLWWSVRIWRLKTAVGVFFLKKIKSTQLLYHQ